MMLGCFQQSWIFFLYFLLFFLNKASLEMHYFITKLRKTIIPMTIPNPEFSLVPQLKHSSNDLIRILYVYLWLDYRLPEVGKVSLSFLRQVQKIPDSWQLKDDRYLL